VLVDRGPEVDDVFVCQCWQCCHGHLVLPACYG
jgi:hypothetical protein